MKRPRPCARTATCTVSTLAAGRQHAADRGMRTARDEAHWVHARPGRGRLSASCTPTLRTEIVRERWRASRLPSLRSALRGLDPHHALPVSWHLSERRPVLSHGLDEVEGLHHRQVTRNRRHDAPIMIAVGGASHQLHPVFVSLIGLHLLNHGGWGALARKMDGHQRVV